MLTGYTAGSGTISATDTILSAFQKLGYDKHVAATENVTGLEFSGQQLNLSTGYFIPTTADETNWNTAYSNTHVAVTLSSLTGFTLTGQQLSYTALYSLPLTADTAKGVTAHGWGDHASAGYAILAGRAGGQTLVGGNATAEDLHLYANAANDGTGIVYLGYTGSVLSVGASAVTMTGSLNLQGCTYALPLMFGDNGFGFPIASLYPVTTAGSDGLYCSTNFHVNAGYVRSDALKLKAATSTKLVLLQALATTAADYTITLPPDGGTTGYLVQTNGSGVLSYVNPATLTVDHAATAGNADTASQANDATTWGNLSNSFAQYSLLMRTSAGAGVIEELVSGATGTKYLRDDGTWQTVTASLPGLADGKIWVGDSGGAAVARTPTGDVTISNTGVTAIGATKITDAIVNSGAVSILNPTGSIIMYGGATAPTGWVLCDGTSYDKTNATYTALFNVIGTTFGATGGGNNFNVPDMRGIYAKGAGTTNRAAGVDANGSAYAETLGAYVTDKMQGHLHSFLKSASAPGGGGSWVVGGGTTDYTQTPTTDGTNGTPRTGLTTEPQHLGLTHIIKL